MYNITFKYITLTGPVTGPLAPTPYGESTSKINYTTFLISLLEVLVVPAGIEKKIIIMDHVISCYLQEVQQVHLVHHYQEHPLVPV